MKYSKTIKYSEPERNVVGLYPFAGYEITVVMPSGGATPCEAYVSLDESYGRTAVDALNNMAVMLNAIADKAREMAQELGE